MNKGILTLAAGSVLVVLGILFLQKFVELIDIDVQHITDTFENWYELLPYFGLGTILCVCGFATFFYGLVKLNGKNS